MSTPKWIEGYGRIEATDCSRCHEQTTADALATPVNWSKVVHSKYAHPLQVRKVGC